MFITSVDLVAKLTDWRSILKHSLDGATTPPSYMLDWVRLICEKRLPEIRWKLVGVGLDISVTEIIFSSISNFSCLCNSMLQLNFSWLKNFSSNYDHTVN